MSNDVRDQLDSLNEWLVELFHDGHYAQGLAVALKLRDLAREHLGETDADYAASLNNLAALYDALGDPAAALRCYQEAVDIYRMVLGEDDPVFATMLSNLGGAYEATGMYDRAQPLYRQALEITGRTTGKQSVEFAASLNDLALLLTKIGSYTLAEPLYIQAVAIYRHAFTEADVDAARCLNNLGGLYEVTGKYEQAAALHKEALQTARERLGDQHPEVATTANNLGFLYESTGNYAAAEDLYRQALGIRRKQFGDVHPDVADSLNNLAQLHRRQRNMFMAEKLLRQALAIRQQVYGIDHPAVAQSLYNLAGLCAETGRVFDALTLMDQGQAIDTRMIGQVFSIGSEAQRRAYVATLQGRFAATVSVVLKYVHDVQPAVQSAMDLVLRRKAIGAEVLAVQRDAILGGRYPALRSTLDELSLLRRELAQMILQGPDQDNNGDYQEKVACLTEQREALEGKLAREIPEMNLQQRLQTVDRQVVADALSPQTVLIEFVRLPIYNFRSTATDAEPSWGADRYLAFVLHAGKSNDVHLVDLGEAEPIDQLIADFRTAITGQSEGPKLTSDSSGYDGYDSPIQRRTIFDSARSLEAEITPPTTMNLAPGQRLRRQVWDKLLPALKGCTHVFLAPDGDLSRLPFEVLPLDDDRYVINDYHISYLSVGRDLLRFGSSGDDQHRPALVVGDPNFGFGSSGEHPAMRPFRRLKGTQTEANMIAALLHTKSIIEDEALEGWLKEATAPGRSPQMLHLATHGVFLPDQQDPMIAQVGLIDIDHRALSALDRLAAHPLPNPLLRSGLALAGANTWLRGDPLPSRAEDGLLFAEDVTGCDLLNTELVVLSACDSGLGEVHVGEGVFGLRRAFMLAGAKTLVMSLWKVPDQQTQELMVDFYERILRGLPRADALRDAQLALKERYDHPVFWGAFICQGQPGPLPSFISVRP